MDQQTPGSDNVAKIAREIKGIRFCDNDRRGQSRLAALAQLVYADKRACSSTSGTYGRFF